MEYLDALLSAGHVGFPDVAARLGDTGAARAAEAYRPGPPTELPPEAAETIALVAGDLLLVTFRPPQRRGAGPADPCIGFPRTRRPQRPAAPGWPVTQGGLAGLMAECEAAGLLTADRRAGRPRSSCTGGPPGTAPPPGRDATRRRGDRRAPPSRRILAMAHHGLAARPARRTRGPLPPAPGEHPGRRPRGHRRPGGRRRTIPTGTSRVAAPARPGRGRPGAVGGGFLAAERRAFSAPDRPSSAASARPGGSAGRGRAARRRLNAAARRPYRPGCGLGRRAAQRDAIVACDPAMCSVLQAHGVAAGNLLVLRPERPIRSALTWWSRRPRCAASSAPAWLACTRRRHRELRFR